MASETHQAAGTGVCRSSQGKRAAHGGLSRGRLLTLEGCSVKTRNSKVTSQVQQVRGADVARDAHQRQAFGRLGQHNCATYVHTVHYEPKIRGVVMPRTTGVRCRHEMLPAPHVIGRTNCMHRFLIGNTRVAKAQHMHTYTIQPIDDLPVLFLGVGHKARNHVEQVSIENKTRFHGGLRIQCGQSRRSPFQRYSAECCKSVGYNNLGSPRRSLRSLVGGRDWGFLGEQRTTERRCAKHEYADMHSPLHVQFNSGSTRKFLRKLKRSSAPLPGSVAAG